MVVNEPTYNNSPPWFNNNTLTRIETVVAEIGFNHPSAELSPNNGKKKLLGRAFVIISEGF